MCAQAGTVREGASCQAICRERALIAGLKLHCSRPAFFSACARFRLHTALHA